MSEINVTPFVDVMLVLLIVFMVTAPLLTVGIPVDLPKVKGEIEKLNSAFVSQLQKEVPGRWQVRYSPNISSRSRPLLVTCGLLEFSYIFGNKYFKRTVSFFITAKYRFQDV